jgi:hypothetical protein
MASKALFCAEPRFLVVDRNDPRLEEEALFYSQRVFALTINAKSQFEQLKDRV